MRIIPCLPIPWCIFCSILVLSLCFAIIFCFDVNSGPKIVDKNQLIIGNGCKLNNLLQSTQESTKSVIYVLGGTQDSLILKYKTAVQIFESEIAEKILIASLAGLTEHSSFLNRNLTNDEWTIDQLTKQGIDCYDVIFIGLVDGFFGTLREAQTLKEIVVEKGINRLILVCSAYHYDRVKWTFTSVLQDTGVDIDIYSSDEQVGRVILFYEYLKQILYKFILFQHDGGDGSSL